MRLGTDTASLSNHLMSGTRGQPSPVVGMGVTFLYWTDRDAGTIVAVGPNARWIDVTQDIATRTDGNGMSECQSYSFATDPAARPSRYSLRKNGAYVRVGEPINGQRVRIGDRSKYHDFSF